MSVQLPPDFFTLSSMGTFAGMTGAVFVVTNGLQQATNWHPRWLGLVIALVLVSLGVYNSGGRDVMGYVVGIVNGFLVYLTAGGATGAIGSVAGPIRLQDAGGRRSFLDRWF